MQVVITESTDGAAVEADLPGLDVLQDPTLVDRPADLAAPRALRRHLAGA